MEWLAIVRRLDGQLHKEPMGMAASATEICRRWYDQHDTARVTLVAVVRTNELKEIASILAGNSTS